MAIRHGMVLACLWALSCMGGPAAADTVWTRGGGVLWYPAPPAALSSVPPAVSMRAEIRALPSAVVAVGQVVRFPVRSNRDGFAHLFVRNPDGSFHSVAANRRIVAGWWQYILMNHGTELVARRPAGRTHVTLVVTAMPLDFGGGAVSAMTLQTALAFVPPSSWTVARTHVDVVG